MTEAELKSTVDEYLQYGENLGCWLWFPLFTGDLILVYGDNARRRVRGCRAGTSDRLVIQTHLQRGYVVTFLELKSEKGRQTPAQRHFQKLVEALGCRYL